MKDIFKMNVVKNKSLTYMLPMFYETIGVRFPQFLVNTYVSFEIGDDVFCLLYKWRSDPDFLKYEKELSEHPLYLGHVDFGEKVCYKFSYTLLMKKEKDLFLNGRYKEFSQSHKKEVINYTRKKGFKNSGRIERIMTEGDPLTSTTPEVEKEALMSQVRKVEFKTETFKDE